MRRLQDPNQVRSLCMQSLVRFSVVLAELALNRIAASTHDASFLFVAFWVHTVESHCSRLQHAGSGRR